MKSTEKEKLYEVVRDKFAIKRVKKFEDKYETILDELAGQTNRSMIIIGCAYLEELCKDCVKASSTKEGWKEMSGNHDRELSFSFLLAMLYSKGHLSEEVNKVFYHVRKIRNIYAHSPILSEKELKSIKSRNREVRLLLGSRWFTRKMDRLKSIQDVDGQLYYIVFENLMFGLIGLFTFLIPEQNLARLQFCEGENFLRINVHVGEFNEYTVSHFQRKFNEEEG